ncbi:MAG: DUF503 domain-containing protein [Pseudomonadota bacterium]
MTLFVQELRVDFYLGACRSLKEKRQRLRGLRDRFGRQPILAVVESDFADSLQKARWSFIAAASAAELVQQQLADVERYLTFSVDAEILAMDRFELSAEGIDGRVPERW